VTAAITAAATAFAPVAAVTAIAVLASSATMAATERIALLPIENLSATTAPVREIRAMLAERLRGAGVGLLDDGALDRFMALHRMRYTAGLSSELGRAIAGETGAGSVLAGSLDQYDEADPPRVAMTMRLLSAGDETKILWADSIALAGDAEPGFLDMGHVADAGILQARVIDHLVGSLLAALGRPALEGAREEDEPPSGRRFRPDRQYRRPGFPAGRWTDEGRPVRVAVLPFANESGRPDAGDLLGLHFVGELCRRGEIEVIEPGVVRQTLLEARLILGGGLSIPQADLLGETLGADLIVVGEVTSYHDPSGLWGSPAVAFTTQAIDTGSRQLVWASISDNHGDDRVVFFDLGRVRTAHDLARAMAREVAAGLFAQEREDRREGPAAQAAPGVSRLKQEGEP
jgi:TolB-like protein